MLLFLALLLPFSGTASAADQATPVVIPLPGGVSAVAVEVGSGSSLVSAGDGQLYTWGLNMNGRLGDGATDNRSSPGVAALPGGVSATSQLSSASHGLLLGGDNQVYSWGDNNSGQLGDGTTEDHWTPAAVTLASGVTARAVAAGGYFSLAIGSDGQVYSWGNNSSGRLGDGTTDHHRATPAAITLAEGVTAAAIAAGDVHALAIGSDGQLYAWGDNSAGQIGDGSRTKHLTPVQVTLASGVTPTAVAAGGYHSLAIGSDGRLYAWGWNTKGQLGDGATGDRLTPQVVELPGGVSPALIAAGYSHSLAVGSDGRLYSWGWNNHGQLGDGSTIDRLTPVAAKVPTGITSISAGFSHSMAAGSDGRAYGWGEDGYGQASGGSTTVALNPPTAVAGVTPLSGRAPLTVSLDGSASSDEDGSIASYAWHSSDGQDASGASAELVFQSGGEYTITLTVTDNDGATDSASQTITVGAANQLPQAQFTATPESGRAPLTVALDAGQSSDPDGQIEGYLWSLSDGRTANGASTELTFTQAGQYGVTLTVTDNDGGTASATRTITVQSPYGAPEAVIEATPTSGTAPLVVSLDGSGSSAEEGAISAYQWLASDGQSASGSSATLTFDEAGSYTVTLTVTDERGAQGTASRQIAVREADNEEPVAVISATPAAGETPLTVSVDGGASSDPDGHIVEYLWSTSDGQSAQGAESSFQFLSAGTYVVTLEVTDDGGASASASYTIRAYAPLKVAPAQLEMGVGEDAVLSASGGVEPYQWSASAGELLTINSRQARYVAPSEACPSAGPCYTVTVTDSLGNTKEVGVAVTSMLRVTPETVSVTLSGGQVKPVRLEAGGGVEPYRWEADGGRVSGHGSWVNYTPPAEVGSWQVIVTDAQESQATARVEVVELPVINPDAVTLSTGETVTLELSGGVDPVSWIVSGGELSPTSGRTVTYTAPQTPGRYRVIATDGDGRTARALVSVAGDLRISPAEATVGVGEPLHFAAARGEPPYTWPDGRHGRSWNTRFDTVGSQQVEVTDSTGATAVAEVRVVNEGLEVTPAHAAVPPGDVVKLSVAGGEPPYRWSADAGSLNAEEGSEVTLVAPFGRGEYAVTATDSAGISGVARVRVTAAMVENPACAPQCGSIESDISIDGVERPEGESRADEDADLDIGFRVEAPDDGHRHKVYAALVWSLPDGQVLTFFHTGDPEHPLQLWEGGEMPAYGESGGGESTDVEFYQGGGSGLHGVFDFFVGLAPADDPGGLSYNQHPYRVELE
ncbi:hypothetical protein JCM17961_24500 [Endothiovibrio diazotrophicus]